MNMWDREHVTSREHAVKELFSLISRVGEVKHRLELNIGGIRSFQPIVFKSHLRRRRVTEAMRFLAWQDRGKPGRRVALRYTREEVHGLQPHPPTDLLKGVLSVKSNTR
jgi:hypothetical protein